MSPNSVSDTRTSVNGEQLDRDLLAEVDELLNKAQRSPEQAQRERLAQQMAGNGSAKVLWTAGEILTTKFPDPIWIVPNLLPSGLSILAGRPKIGKSWLGLQMAVAVGTGGVVLDEQVTRRRVFYLALEDSPLRLQNRLQLQGCPSDASIDFATTWKPLIDTGLDELITAIEVGRYEFVVVDTLHRFSGERKSDDEKLVAQRLAHLQRFAVSNNISVLLIDHHRKPAAGISDVIDDVMGATAKTGVADAALGLYRARGQQGAELKLTGRDVNDRELAVQFDKKLCCWQSLGDASGVRSNSLQAQILELMESDYEGVASCSEIAKALGKQRSNIHNELQELVAKCRVVKVDKKEGREVKYKVVGQ